MQSEQEWLMQDVVEHESYKYFMRVDPNMREVLGPIEKEFDPIVGREMRSRWGKVAMLRGSDNLVETRIYLDPLPHIRQDAAKPLQGWYNSKGDGSLRGKRERPCLTDALLTQSYGGHCNVNCGFCYLIAGGRGYRASSLVTVPINYGVQVKKQLASMTIGQAGYFSSFTDPFLPYEDWYHNTQAGATAFVEAGLPIFFLTRLKYPSWAIDLLKKNPFSYAQRSINTPHEDDWRKLSPGAAPLSYIWDELKELHRQGIYISIQCNPIIAGIVSHEDVEQLIEKLAECGVNHVITKFVEAQFNWAPAMVQKMVKAFGDNRAAAFKELFTANSSGQQRVVNWDYRLEGHRRYQKKATEVGLTYATCFEYGPKQLDGTYKSIGADWLTGDTCHGHRVPWHTKGPDGLFQPLSVCPPSGCLSCADDTPDGRGKCGSSMLGDAKAWKLSDLKRPFDGVRD